MARILGTGLRHAPASVAGAPAAVRSTRPGWRDPRMWLGIAIVALSVVAGARVMAAADRTVGVWATAGGLPAGSPVSGADLVIRQVRLGAHELAAYLPAERPVPRGLVAVREIGAGELVPRAALGPAAAGSDLEVPVAVEPAQVPRSVTRGSRVDVYVVARAGTSPSPASDPARGEAPAPARAALTDVAVVDAPALSDAFGASGERQLVLAVPKDEVPPFFGLLQSIQQPMLTVVRHAS